MLFPRSGIEECGEISENAISSVRNLFTRYVDAQTHELFSWGSVARREMGPRSDLDLLIISQNPNPEQIQTFGEMVYKFLPDYHLDLLERHTPAEVEYIAAIDGTDRQAILFLRQETYSDQLHGVAEKIFKRVLGDKRSNLREVIHMFANMEYVYPKLFGEYNVKFGPGRLRDLNLAKLLVKYLDENNSSTDTPSALLYLQSKGYLAKDVVAANLGLFDSLLYLRNRTQEVNNSYDCLISNPETLDSFTKDLLNNCTVSIGNLYENLKDITLDLASKEFGNETSKLLSKMFAIPCKVNDALKQEILESKEEVLVMLLTYIIKNPEDLELIRTQYLRSWYVLYGIANNVNASQDTLLRLMCPMDDEKATVKDLYTDFAWRNIYLYIAKNPAAGDSVRQYILNYPKARPMDIEAALKKY